MKSGRTELLMREAGNERSCHAPGHLDLRPRRAGFEKISQCIHHCHRYRHRIVW